MPRIVFSVLIALVGLAGCSDQSIFVRGKGNPPGPSNGSIAGRVCDPTGRTWLADAIAYTNIFDDNGHLVDIRQAYSDRDGYWLLSDLPPFREYQVYIQYGNELLDEPDPVWLDDGENYTFPDPDCFDPLELNVAVITGDYDEFQLVLQDMGFANYALVDGLNIDEIQTFLLDPDAMSQYDIIFFNGGHVEENVIYDTDGDAADTAATIMQNIQDYVRAGGSIYASDWAYDVIEQGWPDRIDFVGDDSVPDAAQLGEYGLVTATVSDSALAEWLGEDHLSIEYDLPVWPPIQSVADTVSTHLSADIAYRVGTDTFNLAASPTLVSFTSGDGRVAFSTFRVAKNADTDVLLILQYMMYNL